MCPAIRQGGEVNVSGPHCLAVESAHGFVKRLAFVQPPLD